MFSRQLADAAGTPSPAPPRSDILAQLGHVALRVAAEPPSLHQLVDRRVETPLIHASWIAVTSAFSAVLRGSGKGGRCEPWRSFGMRRLSVPSGVLRPRL